MATLDRITVSGFKSIGSAELELRKLNVVIGPNGAGKSNLIGVFRLLDNILQRRLQEFVAQQGGANRMLHFGQKKSPSLSVRFDFGVNAYSFVLAANTSDGLFFQRERTHSSGSETPDGGSSLGSGQLEANLPDAPAKGDKVARYVLNGVTRWVVYHFHDTSDSSPPKQTQNVDDNRWLRPDGGNLAAYLLRLQHREQVAFRRITEYVQRVAPFFAEFLLAPRATQPDKIKLEWRQRGSDAYFDGASLSDGTLRFICLATLLLQPSYLMPSVVLIDEPELGLHPSALTLLVEMMRDATSHRQIVAATQSVTLLDHLMPEDVIVAEQDDQGSHFRRLDEPALRAWLDEYALGELWLKMCSAAVRGEPRSSAGRGADRGGIRQSCSTSTSQFVRGISHRELAEDTGIASWQPAYGRCRDIWAHAPRCTPFARGHECACDHNHRHVRSSGRFSRTGGR